jgi:hypothetical protein
LKAESTGFDRADERKVFDWYGFKLEDLGSMDGFPDGWPVGIVGFPDGSPVGTEGLEEGCEVGRAKGWEDG